MLSKQLHCPGCGYQTTLGADDIVVRLRLLGHLRRDADPDEGVLAELLASSAQNMTCPTCKSVGLGVSDTAEQDDADDWQAAVLCEVCRQPIPEERLEFAPDAKRCVGCQEMAEQGTLPEEPDFCPRCGSLVELRVSRGSGLTRYKRFCTGDPPCRL